MNGNPFSRLLGKDWESFHKPLSESKAVQVGERHVGAAQGIGAARMPEAVPAAESQGAPVAGAAAMGRRGDNVWIANLLFKESKSRAVERIEAPLQGGPTLAIYVSDEEMNAQGEVFSLFGAPGPVCERMGELDLGDEDVPALTVEVRDPLQGHSSWFATCGRQVDLARLILALPPNGRVLLQLEFAERLMPSVGSTSARPDGRDRDRGPVLSARDLQKVMVFEVTERDENGNDETRFVDPPWLDKADVGRARQRGL